VEFELSGSFPVGTDVGAYPADRWPEPPSGAPRGAAIDTATVAADGTATLSLEEGVRYYVAGEVDGRWVYVSVSALLGPSGRFATLDGEGKLEEAQLPDSVVSGSADPEETESIPVSSGTTSRAIQWLKQSAFVKLVDAWRGHYNVKAWGAKGDGKTDDHSALATVIEKAEESGRGATIFFPPGRYYIGTGLTILGPNICIEVAGVAGDGISGNSGERATAELVSDVEGLVLLTIGDSSSTRWRGPMIGPLAYEDSSAEHNKIAGAIRIYRTNSGRLDHPSFFNILGGFCVQTKQTSGNPQYWEVYQPQAYQVKQFFDDNGGVDWRIFGGKAWGSANTGEVRAGSVGCKIEGNGWRFFGTEIQYFESEWKISGNQNFLIAVAVESKEGSKAKVGVEISGKGNVLSVDGAWANEYSEKMVHVTSTAKANQILGLTTGSGTVTNSSMLNDEGEHTMLLTATAGPAKLPYGIAKERVVTIIEESATIPADTTLAYIEAAGTLKTIPATFNGHRVAILAGAAVTLKSGTGNLKLEGGTDKALTSNDVIELVLHFEKWHQVAPLSNN
jgi:hypothetical protein